MSDAACMRDGSLETGRPAVRSPSAPRPAGTRPAQPRLSGADVGPLRFVWQNKAALNNEFEVGSDLWADGRRVCESCAVSR